MANSQAQDNQNFKFDFDEAVAAARLYYPEETRDITFVDISRPDAVQRVADYFAEEFDFKGEQRLGSLYQYLDEAQREKQRLTEAHLFISRFFNNGGAHNSGEGLLLLDSKLNFNLFGNQAKDAAFAFNHELGHLLVRKGLSTPLLSLKGVSKEEVLTNIAYSKRNKTEIDADCFGILLSIAQGIITIEDIPHISLWRARAWDPLHETGCAVDHMRADMKDVDLSALTLKDIKERPAFYAEEFSPSNEEVQAMIDALKGKTLEEILENMIDICLKAPDDSFTSYSIIPKLSMIFALTARITDSDNIDVTDPKWEDAKKMLADRVTKIGAPYLLLKQS